MAKGRLQISLDPDVVDLLEKVGGSKSEYLCQVVRDRWQEWTQALDGLRAAGWRDREIKAACDALNGYWMLGPVSRAPQPIALELHDADRLNGLSEKWEIDKDRWDALIKNVHGNAALAESIATVVREFWAGNTACERAIDTIGGGR